ncbi:MAG TPA: acyl-CoA dehydrogenase family protein [Candidatus Binataceae bacterium]|nr:acyl-CoA dehydrogenase family protein [Candidatus Binataceae bacterium]
MTEQSNKYTPSPGITSVDPVVRAKELTALIRAHADETERGRRLAAPVVDALRSAGLFTMGLPVALGGTETSVPAALRAIEHVAYADGATGWNVMIAFDTGMLAGYLHGTQAREMIASISQPVVANSVFPPGRLDRVTGGYRLTGQWRFGSGCQQADVFIVGAIHADDAASATSASAILEKLQLAVLPAGNVTILDTWYVSGMRGTGSHDYAVDNLFVPDGLVEPLRIELPHEPGPLYAFGIFPAFGVVKAAVALGIAHHAIEAFKELASAKTPAGHSSLLRERSAVQTDLARAQACVRSAQAFLHQTTGEIWQSVIEGNRPSTEQRAWLRLAGVDGVQRAIQAVDLVHNAAAATAIFESCPLERCFRDVHVIPAHIVVQPNVYELAGRVFLGLPPGAGLF